MNPLNPDRMSSKERIAEVSRILAIGLIPAAGFTDSNVSCGDRAGLNLCTQNLNRRSMTLRGLVEKNLVERVRDRA
jgi:hypothetical protein